MEQIAGGVNPGNKEPPKKDPDYFPCFLCGEFVEIKMTIKGKPYFICDPCGLQAFIRRDKGIKRLEYLIGEKSFDSPEIKSTPHRVLNWVNQLEKLRGKLREIEDNEGFFPNKNEKELKEIIRGEIRKIEKKIRKK